MSFGLKQVKKSKVVELEETLGYTTTYSYPGSDSALLQVYAKKVPEFRELDKMHLAVRRYLR